MENRLVDIELRKIIRDYKLKEPTGYGNNGLCWVKRISAGKYNIINDVTIEVMEDGFIKLRLKSANPSSFDEITLFITKDFNKIINFLNIVG